MSATSFEIYSKEHASGEKFDYYICSAAGALFAYIGQTYTPHSFDSWYYYITPSALLALTACFGIGLWTISISKEVTRLSKELFAQNERIQLIIKMLDENRNQAAFINLETNQPCTRNEMENDIKETRVKKEALHKDAMKLMSKGNNWNFIRNWLLGLGFFLILASKVLQPYFIID